MKQTVAIRALLLVAALAFQTNTRAEETISEIKFSEPTKPGIVKISLVRGELHVRGIDAPSITVKSDVKGPRTTPRKDGLRELGASSTFILTEKDNVVTLDASAEGTRTSSYFNVTVPRSTSLVISNSSGGDISCVEVNGDLEIKNTNGDIKLVGVAGAALVETIQGEVSADVRELHDGKPLSFTSINGEITIRLPAEANANVRLRSQNGAILTDFDEKAFVTKTESVARSQNKLSSTETVRRTQSSSSDLNAEIRTTVKAVVKAGLEAAHEAASAAREAAAAAREAIQESNESGDRMPRPPRPALPPMTGGKIVTGTLNQGGAEIQAATMNGDVTLRKLVGQ